MKIVGVEDGFEHEHLGERQALNGQPPRRVCE